MNSKIKNVIIITFLTLLMILNFSTNFLGDNNADIVGHTFKTFQNDSEYLVFSEIFQDKYNLENNHYGLAEIVDESGVRINDIWNIVKKYDSENNNIQIKDYISQYGLQGHIFSIMYNKMHIHFWGLKLICCTILAIIIIYICFLISKKYNKLMGIIFYITFLLSPWLVAFARNLYWVEFTWFLPVLFGLVLSMKLNNRKYLLPCIFISIFIKCLCGYEYISTIMLMTISFLVIDFFVEKDKSKRKTIFITILLVGITCLIAFLSALSLHAVLRGDGNIIEGIKSVYEKDVLRRTLISSNVNDFPEIYRKSLEAGIIETVAQYFEWRTDIILGINGRCFKLIVVATIAIIICNILNNKKEKYQELAMFIVFFVTSTSWYVLGKSHSYIHLTMNYVLWYFGFIQICLYIIVKNICQILRIKMKI